MSYTKRDVKDLRDALVTAKTAKLRTHEGVIAIFDFDFETARTAEAIQLLHDAEEKIDEAIKFLDHEYNRIGMEVAVDEAAGVER